MVQNPGKSMVRAEQAARLLLRALTTYAPAAIRILLGAALLLNFAHSGQALEPTTPLQNYARQTWAMENGLPQNTVQALVQTQDGFVWLGTEVGLVRFDGNGFAEFDRNSSPALPGNDVRCLLETRDGSLWIGTSDGLARWRDGKVTAFTTREGLPANGIEALGESRDGVLQVLTDQGLSRLEGERFAAYTAADAASGGMMTPAALPALGIGLARPLPDGAHVLSSKSELTLIRGSAVLARLKVGRELPGSRIQVLFADRESCLWIGTNGGLARLADGKLQMMPVTDPLATASVLAVMEDHEGNVWVGTEAGGLHILREQRFRTIGTREGLTLDGTTAVVEDRAGTIWVGTSGGGLDAVRLSGGKVSAVRSYSSKDGLLSDVILSLAPARNGDLWVGTPDGLNRIRGGSIESFTSADGLPDDFIRSLLADADGSLWIGTRRGLTHWPPGNAAAGMNMETFKRANGLGSDLVGAMARDAQGDLWVATLAGLSRLHGGRIANYTTADGLSSNVVTALLPRENGTLLIGTQDKGWDLYDGKRFSASAPDRLSGTSIHAILDDSDGHLWFATGDGIARCDVSGGVEHALCIEFGTADGLRSRETASSSHPSAWRSTDGHLWFATPKGLVEVDPAHFPVNAIPSPVAIERFAVDDVTQPTGAAGSVAEIPAGHVHFEFDYAGLSFAAPQKVRYRFMLENFDRQWTEAGARRSAYYTNIPPGSYTFRVQAANSDGVWNDQGAALKFELRPHFYQTAWFYALLVLAAAGILVLLLRLRIRRAEREFNAVLGERNRIAREIHDTLAQGYVGISVQLELLGELLRQSKVEQATKQLEVTRGHVREGLADARQSIWALRSQDSGEKALPVRLRRMVEAAEGNGVEARFSIHGAYRPLPPGTEQEILRVAQEAIHNIKKHALARSLFVQLEYGQREIALEVRDDGQGFASDKTQESFPEGNGQGHYGLTGMKERAAVIGGVLDVTSEPGVGTAVRLRAPAPREMQE
jgi:signal transduction histidine kinase/ligand-binding sensor domain-containing protein